jgi:predicted small lipoprotein YifL
MTARRALPLVALAALTLVGCGKKGPPVAPEQRVPAAVADLAAVVRESAVELAWTNPTRRADRTLLRDLTLARVYRREDDGRGAPAAPPLSDGALRGFAELATIRLAAPEPAMLQGNRIVFTDREGLVLGRRYAYVVVTADSLGRVGPPSRQVSVAFLAAPEAPAAVAARPGEREARLGWRPPERLSDGSAVPGPLAYEVLRAPAPDAPLGAAGRTAEGTLAFTDRDLENDRTYYYAVRAVRTEAGTTVLGALSPRVAVTPRKVTPPAPPADLVAIASEGAVRLSWRASPTTDVSGYVVYRAPVGGAFVRIGVTQAPAATFIDRDVPRGAWRYAVTAEDSAAIRNESRRSNEATVTVP